MSVYERKVSHLSSHALHGEVKLDENINLPGFVQLCAPNHDGGVDLLHC